MAHPARLRLFALVVVAALGLAACSGDDGSSGAAPSATAPTGATGGDAATAATAAEPVDVEVTASDGVTLAATVFGDGPTTVVLGHMRGTGKETWFPFAQTLAAEGYRAVAFDFRGYGGSEGERDTDLDVDYAAMVADARARGAERVFLIGASMGGTGAVVAAADLDLDGVVSVSGPAEFQGLDARAAAGDLDEPSLFVAAKDDQPYATAAADMADASGGDLVLYDGSSHGTNLFDDHGDELGALLLAFVS